MIYAIIKRRGGKMNLKRASLVIVLIAIFIVCFQSMNNKYDPLARYKYTSELTNEQRDKILEHMDSDDIDFMIQQKLKPDQYLKYIDVEDFSVKNTLYYELCSKMQPADINYIVYFINKYKSDFNYADLKTILASYSYANLEEFYNGAYTYVKEAKLVSEPSSMDVQIKASETLYKYIPKDLVTIDNTTIPIASLTGSETIQIKAEVVESLKKMCADLGATNNKTCGGLILTKGYVSYEDQVKVYENALVNYGYDDFSKYEDFPGQSEHQLGYSLTFTIASMDAEQMADSDQVKWLKENAKKYGFVIRYPETQETKTGKKYQPLTLRYIGKNNKNYNFDFLNF